jgi:TPR repeat protein
VKELKKIHSKQFNYINNQLHLEILIQCLISLFCYQCSYSIEKDQSIAVELYHHSAQLGNLSAMYNLAICYQIGNGVGINFQVAFELFLQASNKRDVKALSYCFFSLSM